MKSIQLLFRSLILVLLFSLQQQEIIAQDSLLVKWNIISKEKENGTLRLIIKGKIPKDWRLYQINETEGLSGLTIKSSDTAVLMRNMELKTQSTVLIDPIFDGHQLEVWNDSVVIEQTLSCTDSNVVMTQLLVSYELAKGNELITEEQKIPLVFNDAAVTVTASRILIPTIDIHHPKENCGSTETATASRSLWSLFLVGFLGGLIALLTPCVFPMIPLTVSFFTKRAQNRKKGITNAFLYGFFIFLIYVLLSLPFHFLDSINPEFLNNISTNVYLNIIFFLVFIVFALSFFGLFEITLPASFSTGADSKAGVSNLVGIFFMALTLALVSFSCTGPILGSLLAGSLASNGGAMQLTAGMAGFGLALALPFALFALFPHWLQSLPKSGGWLTTVKVTLGFLELAMAFKFLSNADMVMHWGLLKREIFIGIWLVISFALSLYLFGILKIGHDASPPKLSAGRKFLAIFFMLMTAYLTPGLTNTKYANLQWISGFPPPLYYSLYTQESECVLGLNCTKDFEAGMALAKKDNKPVLIDFTGYACVNCRKMEESVWDDPEVYKLMKEKFVVISLYVDDKKPLPLPRQFTYTTKDGIKKDIVTYGDLWATLQTENFANNSQPWYAIINTKEELMNHPVGYTPDKQEYLQWLQCGWKAAMKK